MKRLLFAIGTVLILGVPATSSPQFNIYKPEKEFFQTGIINGKVTNEKGDALGGVTVQTSVYDAINQVRVRPGINMPEVDQSRYNTKETLRDYIRHERRVEFALEGQRYNDLKRWNIAHIKLPTLKTPSNTPLVFDVKNYVLPFSQSELDNNPALVQNQGY